MENQGTFSKRERCLPDGTEKKVKGQTVVALVCSAGGPKTLQTLLPMLPANLAAPVLLVQHMPEGFTGSLAARLDGMSEIRVKEAEDGEEVRNGIVYVAPGGKQFRCVKSGGIHRVSLAEEPRRDVLRPSGDVLYQSLAECGYSNVMCVVLTGMGKDGTKGIDELQKKKNVFVMVQDEDTSVIYGMPRSVVRAGLAHQVVPLERMADRIAKYVGVI